MVHRVRHLVHVEEKSESVLTRDPEEIGLHTLKPAPGSRKARKRVGRGQGSGTGKTSGRGQKGAGSRSGAKDRTASRAGRCRSTCGCASCAART